MPKQFSNCRKKIGRADKHIADMDFLLDIFHQPSSYTLREERDPKTGQKFIEYGFAKTLPTQELALIMGDAVHNLRCALDYAWIHCLRKIAPEILGRKKNPFSKFPIYESQSELESKLVGHGVKLANSDFYKLIVSEIKPYDGGYDLWAIHYMDIWDKHKLLIPALDVASSRIVLEDDKGNTRSTLCAFTRGGRYSYPIADNEKLKGQGDIRLDVVFQEGLPYQGRAVSPELNRFSKSVLSVVETLESFLETLT